MVGGKIHEQTFHIIGKKTTVLQKLPVEIVGKVAYYIMRVKQMHLQSMYTADRMIAMDKVALWFDMLAETTLDIRGTRSIPIKTSGHEKYQFTVCLAASANGHKLWPFKGKRPDKALNGIYSRCTHLLFR